MIVISNVLTSSRVFRVSYMHRACGLRGVPRQIPNVQTANKKVDEENSSVSEKLIDHQRYFSECLTMELLEKYHEWINE